MQTDTSNLIPRVPPAAPLLEVRNLRTEFRDANGIPIPAVDGISFSIYPGQTMALVGESGCGKSVSAMSILRLVPEPPGKITAGEIIFNGQDLLKLPEKRMRQIRGGRIAMIFQEPMTSLNPVFTIGDQIMEAIDLHQKVSFRDAMDLAVDSLKRVGVADPARRLREFPHQMSGGMKQRIMIAMALACKPDLLIADEPTTALDVTIQAQILELLAELRESTGMALLLITHDLGVVAENADTVAIMYAGRIVEFANVYDLFDHPLHPYTQGLLSCVPRLGHEAELLTTIPGTVPNPRTWLNTCRFEPRCTLCPPGPRELCRTKMPELKEVTTGHWAATFSAPNYSAATTSVPNLNFYRTHAPA